LTLNANGGDAAGEDLIITANNIALTADGALSLTPDGTVTTAIDLTDSGFTNAISLADNNITGTTYTVTASGVLTLDGAGLTVQTTGAGTDITLNAVDK